jgi:hypothetical protein
MDGLADWPVSGRRMSGAQTPTDRREQVSELALVIAQGQSQIANQIGVASDLDAKLGAIAASALALIAALAGGVHIPIDNLWLYLPLMGSAIWATFGLFNRNLDAGSDPSKFFKKYRDKGELAFSEALLKNVDYALNNNDLKLHHKTDAFVGSGLILLGAGLVIAVDLAIGAHQAGPIGQGQILPLAVEFVAGLIVAFLIVVRSARQRSDASSVKPALLLAADAAVDEEEIADHRTIR